MKSKVTAPAIGLLVVAICSAILFVVGLFGDAFNESLIKWAEQSDMPPEQLEQIRSMTGQGATGALSIFFMALHLVGTVLIGLGALRMKNLQSYGLAVTASILAMIPCTSGCCCLVGLPIGIWALIVLMDKDVKAAFGAPQPPPL
jgi:hypothetical protein